MILGGTNLKQLLKYHSSPIVYIRAYAISKILTLLKVASLVAIIAL